MMHTPVPGLIMLIGHWIHLAARCSGCPVLFPIFCQIDHLVEVVYQYRVLLSTCLFSAFSGDGGGDEDRTINQFVY